MLSTHRVYVGWLTGCRRSSVGCIEMEKRKAQSEKLKAETGKEKKVADIDYDFCKGFIF